MNKSFALLAALSLGPAAFSTQAEISVDVFYNSLEPYGDWMEVGDYGYVWHPKDVDESWRPYSDGQWSYTDAGWTWVSDEPHGWATYHYGRWARVENTGWVWVPGTEWGPAWVSWRRSEQHVGWAPLPPEAKFSATVSIGNWADSYYDIGPANYTFVEVRHLGAPRLRTVILPARENITFVRETRNITNIVYQNNIVINEGPRYDEVVRVSAEPIRRLRLERQTDFRDAQTLTNYRTRVEGDTLRIASPAVTYDANLAPRRVARKVATAQVNRGWSGAPAQKQELERMRTTMRQETQAPANLPPQPRFEREERSTTAGTAADPGAAGSANRTGRAAAGTSTTPGATSAQGTSSTPPDANTKKPTANADSDTPPATDANRPGMRGNRKDSRTGENAPATDVPGRPGRATRPGATGTIPDATTPADSNRPAATPDTDSPKPGAANRPGTEDRPDTASTPDSKSPDKTAKPDSAKPARGNRPDADDSKNRPGHETKPDAEKPNRSDRSDANRPEAPGRAERPGRGSDTDASRADLPSRTESPRNERPDRTERTNRPEASERSTRPEAPERSNRPESATRPEAAARAEGAAKHEAAPRANRPEKPAQAERESLPERPNAEAERPQPKRAENPKPERNAAAEQPKANARAAEPKAAQARNNGDDEKERGKKKE